MRRKEEKGGDYFWIKGPVDLFLFSAFLSNFNFYTLPPFLVPYPSVSSSKLSQFRTFSLLTYLTLSST